MSELEFRCDYLTPAFWNGSPSSNPAEDYREILAEVMNPEDLIERIKSALTSGFTLAIFNGAVAFGSLDAHDADFIFPDLKEAFDQCSEIDQWKEQGGTAAAADLSLTLNLIQMEILESIGRSGLETPEALSLLISALSIPNDALHFAALHSIQTLGNRTSEIAGELKEYLNHLDQLELPVESVGNLKNAADHALGSSS